MLTLALPKGRLYAMTVEILRRAGMASRQLPDEDGRSLLVDDAETGFRYLILRPADVPTFVERGAADAGIAGKDVLLEAERDVYELLDLGYMRCRLVLAAPSGTELEELPRGARPIRVATKYPRLAAAYFRRRAIPAEIIALHGNVEVAPAAGLADAVVDMVETGRTLRENDLAVIDVIAETDARLVANRAAYRLKAEALGQVVRRLEEAVVASAQTL